MMMEGEVLGLGTQVAAEMLTGLLDGFPDASEPLLFLYLLEFFILQSGCPSQISRLPVNTCLKVEANDGIKNGEIIP